jgi:hypothetical protein
VRRFSAAPDVSAGPPPAHGSTNAKHRTEPAKHKQNNAGTAPRTAQLNAAWPGLNNTTASHSTVTTRWSRTGGNTQVSRNNEDSTATHGNPQHPGFPLRTAWRRM